MTNPARGREALLVRRVADGDRRAFAELAEQHAPALGRYIARMLGNAAEVEDIRQETLLRLWTQAERWQPEVAALSTWLHRIAHNLSIDHLRRTARLVHDEGEGNDTETKADAAAQEGGEAGPQAPDLALDSAQLAKQVRAAIGTLSERQRSALIMCHYQGLSNRDAATILDVSVDALESLLARARRKLKVQLSEPTT